MGRSHFQGCSLGSVEATRSPVLSQFSPFEGSEGRGKNKKSEEEIKEVIGRFLGGHRHPPPQVLNPMSLHSSEFYRSYKHPLENQPNCINSLSSASTELRILKLIQGFYKPNKYSCKNAIGKISHFTK